MTRWILIALIVVVLGGAAFMLVGLWRLGRNQPTTEELALGVREGRLAPCPESPNCVSTQADPDDQQHRVEPLSYEGERAAVYEAVISWIAAQGRARIERRDDRYIHAVFRSRLFGFQDDVELYFPEGESVVHVRSASRVGYGDMGVNRKRYEAIREVITGDVAR